jgi:hypothetical protein
MSPCWIYFRQLEHVATRGAVRVFAAFLDAMQTTRNHYIEPPYIGTCKELADPTHSAWQGPESGERGVPATIPARFGTTFSMLRQLFSPRDASA